ncbi:phosphotransferase [Streptosporangium sp. NPDC051022]|uniref:aminoglycoside phosphotransferase family protein n=1 Tax=Streptosporangium sp. NPDC051022 TaxID=3155752 RepID=UPI003438711E
MTEHRWDTLPTEVRDTVTAVCGPIQQAMSLPGGLTAGLAARLDTTAGPVFLKALPDDAPSAPLYQRERLVGAAIPSGVPSPRMLWSGHTAGWIVLLLEYIETAGEVDLSPASPYLPDVIDLIRVLGEILTPNPGADVPPVSDNVEFLCKRADALLAAPPSDLESLAAYQHARAGLNLDALAGATLLHADLHEGNLLAVPGGVRVIDWGLACQGATWVETALFVPRLILAGHTPEQAEQLATQVPAWKAAPESAVTGLAAVWSLFREFVSRNGPAGIQASRAAAAAAGRAWVEYRTT